MRGAPIHPDEYDGEHLNTDEKLEAEGWAAGLKVWEQVGKGYSERYIGDDALGNAQLWSLQQAIRAHALAEVWRRVVFNRDNLAPDLAVLAAAQELGVRDAMANYVGEYLPDAPLEPKAERHE